MITRFAPSPSGPLHLGHAFSAATAHRLAQQHKGTFLLRMEDIDQSRCTSAWETLIYDDLKWLGLSWARPVKVQSQCMGAYADALDTLWRQGLLYPCTCTRGDIRRALSAPQEGDGRHAVLGPDGMVYPGTCRHKRRGLDRTRPKDAVLRLRIDEAACGQSLSYVETMARGEHRRITVSAEELVRGVGDIVVSRKGMATSYHLSVVVDDHSSGITDVVRGEDLSDATQIHVLLQRLLGLSTPTYHHHRLIRDKHGKRLAKRDDAKALQKYREQGCTPADVLGMLGLSRTEGHGV